jgi:hypothetical protein
MKRWVDVTEREDHVWLVLVFHGIEGIGWEPKSEAEMVEYLDYIDARTDDLWVATYRDGVKYVRERMATSVSTTAEEGALTVRLTHTLSDRYDLPLTLRTAVPASWSTVQVTQGDRQVTVDRREGSEEGYVQYRARPNAGPVRLSPQ